MRARILIIVLAAILGAGVAAVTAARQQAPTLTIEEVADNLYIVIGSGGNVGVLVTDEGVILIDDKFEQNYDEIVRNVSSVMNQPIRYVINTHYHSDHAGGNSRFPGGRRSDFDD